MPKCCGNWQYWQLLERTVAGERLREIARQLLQRPNLPVHLDPDMFDDLPETPGVYVFYGSGDKALYIARAAQLRQRVLAHFHREQPSNKDAELAKEARRFEWFEAAGDIGAQLLEACLMRRLQPPASIGRPTEADVCAWRIVDGKPELIFADDPDFAREVPCYGMFTSRQKAEMALAALAEKNGIGLAARSIDSARLQAALSSLPLVNWPYPGPVLMIEHGSHGQDDMHLVDRWHWLGTAQDIADIALLREKAPAQPSFEFDTYRILSRAIAQGKVEVRQLS
jgi:DNA polymerase III subunit epsilon